MTEGTRQRREPSAYLLYLPPFVVIISINPGIGNYFLSNLEIEWGACVHHVSIIIFWTKSRPTTRRTCEHSESVRGDMHAEEEEEGVCRRLYGGEPKDRDSETAENPVRLRSDAILGRRRRNFFEGKILIKEGPTA